MRPLAFYRISDGADTLNIVPCILDSSGMDFRSMLKKKKYAKWGNDDQGPDWGDLKHHDQEPEPEIEKVKEVRERVLSIRVSGRGSEHNPVCWGV